ncbi:GH20422 [Drosophila grimshawi]|uniref:GH20422 n=1 Tax=Drosophila grimshawi TaxID=7222 RepID=B4J9S4_DROGR|nr:GH20422 [Drosophila grimshawi]
MYGKCLLFLLAQLLLLHLQPRPQGIADAFNYSPKPNFVIRAPQNLKFNLPQVRSSYFGYTLVMRQTR